LIPVVKALTDLSAAASAPSTGGTTTMTKDTLQMNWKRIEDLDHDERKRIEEMCNGDERETNTKIITSSKEALALAFSIRTSALALSEQLETYDSYFPDLIFDHVFNALNELDTRMKEAGADWEMEMKAEAEAS
jgi:hypothetical protein